MSPHPVMNKEALIELLREALEGELGLMKRLATEAAEAATHEENRPENDKDMRSTEASYVARGQAERAKEIERDLTLLRSITERDLTPRETIAAGALIELNTADQTSHCFLIPGGGGRQLTLNGVEVLAISPQSPLGRALLGLSEGDEAEVRTPQGLKRSEIVSVR